MLNAVTANAGSAKRWNMGANLPRDTRDTLFLLAVIGWVAFMQVGQAFATRSSIESLRTIGWRSNPLMLAIAGGVIALQLLALYTPLSEFLDLDALSAADLAVCVAAGVGLLGLVEIVKAFHRASAPRNG